MLVVLFLTLAATPLEQAQALEEQGEDAAAATLLEKAVIADPKWAIGRVELGRLQLKQGVSDFAFQHLDVARSLAPENPRAHYLFALAADEVGRRDDSRRSLEVALTLRAGFADAQLRLAGLLFSDGDFRGAVTVLKPYVAVHPESNGARLQLADALDRSGDAKGAESELRQLLQVSAVKVLAGRRLVALLEASGRAVDADKVRRQVDPPKRQLRDLQPSSR